MRVVLPARHGSTYEVSRRAFVGCRYLSVMAGAIPESLGQLHSLKTVTLGANKLYGVCGCVVGTSTRRQEVSPAELLGGLRRTGA